MKKQIIITLILILATAFTTVVYFKNLNPPGVQMSKIIAAIPADASIIFEYNNDKSFYDIFTGTRLFPVLLGEEKLKELDTLQHQLLFNQNLQKYFDGQNIFVSLHPSDENILDFVFTISVAKGFDFSKITDLFNSKDQKIAETEFISGKKKVYTLYFRSIQKTFYLTLNDDNILSGSFSKKLITENNNHNQEQNFKLPSDIQNANSLANLYINYNQLNPLFLKLFKNKNSDLFLNLRQIAGLGSLNLNYHTDAALFTGFTNINLKNDSGYLRLFTQQKPVINQLKDIAPSTTAYSTTFSVSDPVKFQSDLTNYQTKKGLKNDKEQLFKTIRNETGIRFRTEFNKLLGNEFAVLTTKYFEKFAIISVKDGSKLKLLLTNVCKMSDSNSGLFKYNGVPFLMLGDPFINFKRPYFTVIDNYLILANTANELKSFYDLYLNRKYMIKNDKYKAFDYLLAEQSNVSFLLNFKNILPILKREMIPEAFDIIDKNESAYNNFYAASCQLSASDGMFYSNYCLKLNPDSLNLKAEPNTK